MVWWGRSGMAQCSADQAVLVARQDLIAREVDVLYAEATALEHAQTRAYSRYAINRGTPSSRRSRALTSARVRTTGSRCGRFAAISRSDRREG